jgi:hypothetical protein
MNNQVSSRFQKYEGKYSYLGFAAIVEMIDNQLVVRAFGRNAQKLIEISEGLFQIENLEGYEIQFNELNPGKISGAKIKMPNGLNYNVNKIE